MALRTMLRQCLHDLSLQHVFSGEDSLDPFTLEHLNCAAQDAAYALRRGKDCGEALAGCTQTRGKLIADQMDELFFKGESITAVNDDMAGIEHPEDIVEHIACIVCCLFKRSEIVFRLRAGDVLKML